MNANDEGNGEEIEIAVGADRSPVKFHRGLHIRYIAGLADKLDNPSSYEGAVTAHLRLSGVYWTYAALSILVPKDETDRILHVTSAPPPSADKNIPQRSSIVDWVLQCYDESTGGFGGNVGHDGHLLYTLSAVQILVMADYDLSQLNVDKIVSFVSSLQQPDGSFAGDVWGEIDTRFSYCALSTLAFLRRMDAVDVDRAADYVVRCQNFDGGFGSMLGAESHAGQVFCCIGALSIAKRLHKIRHMDMLTWWLAERQCDSGGLNGRSEKQADVCYSWWILSVLTILDCVDYINRDKLAHFIAQAQDPEDGGIADRPEDMPDVFHTFFGLSGLSLLGKLTSSSRTIDPVFAMPTDVIKACGVKGQVYSKNAIDERLAHHDVIDRM